MGNYLQLNNITHHAQTRSQMIRAYPTLIMEDVKLSEKRHSPAQREQIWKKVHDYLYAYKSTFLGYQGHLDHHCSDMLKDYLDIHINNGGDPFREDGKNSINTKLMECAVLDYFAKLWNIETLDSVQDENSDRAYWGYVVSMGCTEANLCALYNARDYLCGKPLHRSDNNTNSNTKTKLMTDTGDDTNQQCPNTTINPNAFTPVVFYSEEAYNGHFKALQILRMSTFSDLGSGHFSCPLTYPDDYPSTYSKDFLDQNGWPRMVPVGSDGSMYLPSLVKLVSAFVSRGYPPVVIFTSGTTFKGNYENPQAAINALVPILRQHDMYERRVYYSLEDPSKFDVRHGFWFHVDGALGASHLPFLEMAINKGLISNMFPNGFPVFDFRIPEVMSIAMSIYKWLGCPFPSGIFMIRRKHHLKPPVNARHTCGEDAGTLSGSRNGHGVMVLWDLLSMNSYHDLTERAVRGEKMVMFSLKKFQELEKDLGEDLWLLHSPGSLFICFKQPRKDIVRRYCLSTSSLFVKTKQDTLERRLCCHICLMPHVNEELVENIIEELKEPGAFPVQNTDTT